MAWNPDDLIAEHRGLDFLNTVDDIDKLRRHSKISDWPGALSWLCASGIVSPAEAETLGRDEAGETAFAALIDFRERAYAMFSSVARTRGADGTELPILAHDFEADLRDAIACARPGTVSGAYAWHVDPDRAGADLARYRLVLMLWDLLRGPDLARLKECGRCTWLFLDKARGVGRRWCRMSACGNRAKAERFRKSRSG